LWTISDRKYGGLSFSSKEVGQLLAVSGITMTLTVCITTICKMLINGSSYINVNKNCNEIRKHPVMEKRKTFFVNHATR
jgi:hypothetical protein